MTDTPNENELERLRDYAALALAVHVAANAVIAMRYPETLPTVELPKGGHRDDR